MSLTYSDYLHTVIQPKKLAQVCRRLTRCIRESGIEFDAVAFRGVSGAMVGPIIATRLKKHVVVVRKGEKTHSSIQVESAAERPRYIIVDDFISGGDTMLAILDDIHRSDPDAKCVGIFLYCRDTISDRCQLFWSRQGHSMPVVGSESTRKPNTWDRHGAAWGPLIERLYQERNPKRPAGLSSLVGATKPALVFPGKINVTLPRPSKSQLRTFTRKAMKDLYVNAPVGPDGLAEIAF